MKKTKSKKHKAQYSWRHYSILLLVAIVVTLGAFMVLRHQPAKKNLSEMHTMPKEVKRVLTITPTPVMHAVTLPIRLPILMYHYVEYVQNQKDTTRKSLNIDPDIFESQIKGLQADGYTFLTPSQIPDILSEKMALPQKPIILSFDDGYRDFYTDVYPILKKYHVPAVAYIVPGFLDKANWMLTSQVQQIAKEGLVEIGAHTIHHTYLKGASLKTVTYEVTQSKIQLEQLIHKPVVSFAYPYGAFDLQAIKVVQDAGFTNAVSTLPGINVTGKNTFFLYRIRPGDRTGKNLDTYLQQVTFKPW